MRDQLRRVLVAAAFFGAVAGAFLTHAPWADASRNASGTYSLPSGNPVVTRATITPTWANTTLSDIGSEITASLDRNGKGAMLAPLELANGTVSLPALSFDSDTDTGWYRCAANNICLAVGGVKVLDGLSTSLTFPVAVSTQVGITGTQSTSNGNGATLTGNGSGSGVAGTGGATGAGVSGTGGASGVGVSGTPGTAATAAVPQTAIKAVSGNLEFAPAVNPNASVGFSNTQTPMNLVKAWGYYSTDGAGGITLLAGFNISAVADDGTGFKFTFATAMASTNYAVIPGANLTFVPIELSGSRTSTYFYLNHYSLSGTGVITTASKGSFIVMGAQ